MEKKKKIKRIGAIFALVLTFASLFIVPSFGASAGRENNDDVAVPATNISSLVFYVDDTYTDNNGDTIIPGTILQIDYADVLRNASYDNYRVEVQRPDDVIIDGVTTEVYYIINFRYTKVGGYAKDSLYIAMRFRLDVFYNITGEHGDGTSGLQYAYEAPIKKIEVIYNQHIVHNYNSNFYRPYDGNIDATIGLSNYDGNGWSSLLSVRSAVNDYYRFERGANTLQYSLPRRTTNAFGTSKNSSQVNDPKYIPIGVRYSYTSVSKPNFNFYNENGGVGSVDGMELYRFSTILTASQTIEFDTPYTGEYVITDMYTPSNNSDYRVLERTGVIGVSNFEIGTFLKNSITNFFQLEIMNGFTLESLFWLVVGICGVFAVLAIFIGK